MVIVVTPDMAPDLALSNFTAVRAASSLAGFVAGSGVLLGMLGSRPLPGVTAVLLLTTAAAGASAPDPGLLLAPVPIALAFYVGKLAGRWRLVFVFAASATLWLHATIVLDQAVAAIPYLRPLALTPVVPLVDASLFVAFALLAALASVQPREA